jgi:hypothetical protein
MFIVLSAESLDASSPVFLDVNVESRFLEGPDRHPVVHVRTRQPTRADILVYDRTERIVSFQGDDRLQTEHNLAMTNLPRVAHGLYSFCVVASDAEGDVLSSNPTDPGGGELLELRDLQRDAETGRIEYFLPRAGFVRLRVGLKDGPCLETIKPWSAESAGTHAVPWDGTCQIGLIRGLYDHPALQVTAVAISMPKNMIVDRGLSDLAAGDPPPAIRLPERLREFTWPPWRKASPSETRGELGRVEGDYQIEIDIDTDAEDDTARIRVNCHPHDRSRLFNRRFELMLFLDTVFEMEEEDAILPFTYALSTRDLAAGQHLVTVNIVDVTGRLGTTTRAFVLE